MSSGIVKSKSSGDRGRSRSKARDRSQSRRPQDQERSHRAGSPSPYRKSRFAEEGLTKLDPEPIPDDRSVDNDKAMIEESEIKPETQRKYWAIAFILFTLAYFGLSGYIFFVKLGSAGLGALISMTSITGTSGSIDPSTPMIIIFSAAIGAVLAAVSFAVAVFRPRWLFLLSLLTGGGAAVTAIAMTFWLEYDWTGGIPFAALLCIFAFLGVKWYNRLRPSVAMLGSVRLLTRRHHRFYLIVTAWTAVQGALVVWCILSIGAANHVLNSSTSTCGGSLCGPYVVMGLAAFYILAHYWLAGTLSETLNASLAGSYYSRHLYPVNVDTSFWSQLKLSLWRLLGTRARTALLCDSIEAQVWFLTNVVDRTPWIRDVVNNFSGWYLRLLVRSMESCNRYVGIVSAVHRHTLSYGTFQVRSYPFIMRGHDTNAISADQEGLGRRMGPLHRALRTHIGDKEKPATHWETGLGAFLEAHQTKSLLVFMTSACALAGACLVYVLSIMTPDDASQHAGVSWVVIIWGTYVASSVAYNVLNVVEAGVCTMQVWIHDPWAEIDILATNKGRGALHLLPDYLHDSLDIDVYKSEERYYTDVMPR